MIFWQLRNQIGNFLSWAMWLEQDNAIAPITSLKIGNSYLSKTFPGKLYEPPLMGRGNSSNLKTEWERGFSVPGAFKLDHLQPIKPLLFPNFYNFFTFILSAIIGKGAFSQPQKWMRQWVSSAMDIQTGPYVSLETPFALENFHLFHFHTGKPILITSVC